MSNLLLEPSLLDDIEVEIPCDVCPDPKQVAEWIYTNCCGCSWLICDYHCQKAIQHGERIRDANSYSMCRRCLDLLRFPSKAERLKK